MSSSQPPSQPLSQVQLRQEVEALRQQVSDLQEQLCDRTTTVEELQQENAVLQRRFSDNTDALRESNDTLIQEIVERRQTEEQLHAILDAVPGIVSWISSDLRYLGVNSQLAQTFNLPPEVFIDQDIGFLHTSHEFNDFVRDFFASDQQDAYREVSATVSGVKRRFLIVAQKYNEGRAAFTVGIDITEREQAEVALRQAEAKYRNIFENIVEGIFQTTPDGRYISANPALARIYGYERPEEMIANLTSIQQQLYVNPERRIQFIEALKKQGEVKAFESQIYRKDGSVIWISENAHAVYNDNGQLDYYEGTVEDISDRKRAEAELQKAKEELELRVEQRTAALTESNQRLLSVIRERQNAEEALRASEAELRALFAAMTDVITVFDASGCYLEIVSTNSELLYNPGTERVGKTVYEVLPPYQATLFMRHIQQALNTGQPVRLEYSLPIGRWFRNEDSSNGRTAPDDFHNIAWYAATVSPLPDSRVIWVARDITEKRRSDIALQRAEAKYRSIFENVAEGIFQISPEGHILSANPALAHMLGYETPDELIATIDNISQIYVNSHHRQQMLKQLYEQGTVSEFESQVYRVDGELIWIVENSRAVRDIHGQLRYYEGTAANITQRKQAEEALRESQRTLSTLLGNLAGMAYRRRCGAEPILTFVSQGCYDLTGYHPQELLDPSRPYFGRLVHPDDHGYVGGQLEQAIQTHQPFQLTYRIITATGDEKWVLEKGTGVYNSQGEPIAIEGFLTDISDRKQVENALQNEREKSERLLLNILPEPIAEELKQNPQSIAYRFDEVTILFADIVNFTGLSAAIPPTNLVNLLNQIFSEFDQLAEQHGLEKIKTIGDAYMVVGGLPNPVDNHVQAIAEMALDMQQAIQQHRRQDDQPFSLRIGIDTGPVVAGVIGMKKFSYDLWGDAVNIASRMESQGEAGRIQVTAATYELLQHNYHLRSRGTIDIKGRGAMPTYWLEGRK